MKKLFQLSPLFELMDYQTMKIIGSYHIEHISAQQCILLHEMYRIVVEADEVNVKALQEKQVLVFINGLREMTITKKHAHE